MQNNEKYIKTNIINGKILKDLIKQIEKKDKEQYKNIKELFKVFKKYK